MTRPDASNWELMHQQAHNDFNGALALRGNNLEDVDYSNKAELDEWLYLNFTEHVNAHQAIGI